MQYTVINHVLERISRTQQYNGPTINLHHVKIVITIYIYIYIYIIDIDSMISTLNGDMHLEIGLTWCTFSWIVEECTCVVWAVVLYINKLA